MSVHYTVSSSAEGVKAELLILPVYDDLNLGITFPQELATAIATKIEDLHFKGSWGATEVIPLSHPDFPYPFIAFLGLGQRNKPTSEQTEGFRRGMGSIVKEARRHRLRTVIIQIGAGYPVTRFARGAVEAIELANYRFTDYLPKLQEEQAQRALTDVAIIVPTADEQGAFEAVQQATIIADGVELTRQIVNQPGSSVSPAALVEVAQRIAHEHPSVQLTVLDRAQAEKQDFRAFLAVARGSVHEPYVIHLQHVPKNAQRTIFLVGKGVTFDSGGLSIKPAEMMEIMKLDMAGAAAILGVFKVLPLLNLPLAVHGVIPACENMPSGSAYRPGDIVRAKNGKTIEIINTDAEGRVTLADALSYAVEHTPDMIVDIATLTGACMIALGETVAGLWSNTAQVAEDIERAAAITGEQVCQLPLPREYMALNESKVADLRNLASSRWGGAITAALFLREFVGNIPWAHIDIAAPAYAERPSIPYYEPGATGFGVRLLLQFLKNVAEK